MAVQKPIIVPYNKRSTEAQSVNLAKSSQSVQKKETATGEHTYEIWLARIQSTLRWRQAHYDKDWERAYRLYNGAHWRDQVENNPSSDQVRDRITVNVTMSNVLNMVPFLMSTQPTFVCKPRKPEAVRSADLQSKVLNYEYEQREMNIQVKKAIYDCVTIGHGIVKISYVLELDESKMKGEVLETASYVKEDSPNLRRICPFHFLIDPMASENNLETAEWCGEIIFQPLRKILNNQNYNQSVINNIKRGIYSPGTKSTVFDNLTDASISALVDEKENYKYPEDDLVVTYEIWSKRFQKYYLFADNVPEPLVEKDWPYTYLDNFPYEKVDYIPIADDLYGVGIPYSMEDQQFELNRIRTGQFEHRRRAKRIYVALKNALDTPELNKFLNSETLSVIFENVSNGLRVLEGAPYPEENYIAEANIKQDILDITGQDALVSGGRLPSRTTGTEINNRTSIFRLKLEDRAENINHFIKRVGVKVLQHIKANFSQDRIIMIFGLQGTNWSELRLTEEMIKDEVDVSMESVAVPRVDPMTDRQQRSFVWQTSIQAAPLIAQGLLHINLDKVFGWMMKSFGYEDVGEFFTLALAVSPSPQQTDGAPQQQTNLLNQRQQSPVPSDIAQQNGIQSIFNGGF